MWPLPRRLTKSFAATTQIGTNSFQRVSQTHGTALYASPQRHKDSILVHLSSCLAIATGLLKHLLTLRLIALGITNPATPWTNETLMAALVNHIDKVMYHFGDSCYHWDVVNEAFNDDGTWRDDIWYQTSGPSYISVAFRATNAAKAKYGLKTKLYYNDYNIEYLYPKSYMAQQLVKSLTAQGINVDVVGLQFHFSSDFTSGLASQQQNMQAFTALKNVNGANIEVAVTELDVRVPDTGSTSSPSASVTAAIPEPAGHVLLGHGQCLCHDRWLCWRDGVGFRR